MSFANEILDEPGGELLAELSVAKTIREAIENGKHISSFFSLTEYGEKITKKLTEATTPICLDITTKEIKRIMKEYKAIIKENLK